MAIRIDLSKDFLKSNESILASVQQIYDRYSTFCTSKDIFNQIKQSYSKKFIETHAELDPREILNSLVLNYYPNEATIKASFIKNVLFKSHNHVTVFELPIGESRVDLCKINGSSIAFEIKTEFDNYSRLQKQLKDYSEVFEQVYIVCPKKNLNQVLNVTDVKFGVYGYHFTRSGNCIFHNVRPAAKSMNLMPEKQLEIFTKKELKTVFKLGSNCEKGDQIKCILEKYTGEQINKAFKEYLKKRYRTNWSFLCDNYQRIYEIDYQWFFKQKIDPAIIYR